MSEGCSSAGQHIQLLPKCGIWLEWGPLKLMSLPQTCENAGARGWLKSFDVAYYWWQ